MRSLRLSSIANSTMGRREPPKIFSLLLRKSSTFLALAWSWNATKPKPRDRFAPSAVRRSASRTRLTLAMSACAAFNLSFLALSLTPSFSAFSPCTWQRCLTTASRSFTTSTLVGRLRMLSRRGSMVKLGLFTRHFRSLTDAWRCRCSDRESSCQASLLSLTSPMCRRCIHCLRSSRAVPFLALSRSLAISSTCPGVTADFSTTRRPLRLMPKPSTAGSSRWSSFRAMAESSLSFLSASASQVSAASAPAASTKRTKAEPRWAFWPVWSLTILT
mmetsp:Transcript_35744/g.106134  ORF Transcript_35744/g.106134 Transcript_35744/m.106134 type:complete len:274 (-) Transcript_35744:291-1112(-)